MSSKSRSSSKRPRTPPQEQQIEQAVSVEDEISEVERSPKVPRHRPGEQSPCSGTTEDEPTLEEKLPLAIMLKDYLAPGGTLRYRPRPEWYQAAHLQQNNNDPSLALPGRLSAHVASSISRDASEETGGSRSDDSYARQRGNREENSNRTSGEVPIAPGEAPANGLLPDSSFPDYMLPASPIAASRRITRTVTLRAAQQNSEHSPKVALATPPANSRPNNASRSDKNRKEEPPKPALFGKDWDHALHVAIRENATAAAMALVNDYGVSVHVENAKGFTPMILAAQKGNLVLVRELLLRGADPAHTTSVGMSAVLQAAHFGRHQVLKLLLEHPCRHPTLIEIANYNDTTPLMRASQEGHVECVRLLLQAGADTNRRNRAHLTALMLASQRGHAAVCSLLIQYGASLDARTLQDSTSLLLACKRGHVSVVKELVTAGCELSVQDSRGRTVRDVASRYVSRRENETNEDVRKALLLLLDPAVQIDLMQHQGRRQRNWEMIRVWNLLQQERAHVLPDRPDMNVDAVVSIVEKHSEEKRHLPYDMTLRSTTALLKTMTLTEPLVETITKYLPLPHLWVERLGMLYRRAAVSADDAVMGCLDLMDEILEEGGFLDACDEAQVTPMPHFESWAQWKAWGRRKGVVASESNAASFGSTAGLNQRQNLTTAECPPPADANRPTFTEMRRHAGFLQILAHRSPLLERVLVQPPYKMPPWLIAKLINVSDVASLTRRMGTQGIHFEVSIALDLVSLVSNLCNWYWRERDSVN